KVGAAFSQQLHESIDFDRSDRPLREGLTRLSQAYGVATFLDRRIDPDQPIKVSAHGQPLEEALRTVAHDGKSEITLLGSVVYFGPPEAARDLATLAALRKQEIGKRGADAKA